MPELLDLASPSPSSLGGSLVTKPGLPGSIIGFTGTPTVSVPVAAALTVAVPLWADWGPLGADAPGTDKLGGGPQKLGGFSAWTSLFGDSDTPGRTAVAGAFAGQSLPGRAGAGAVVAYRMAASACAAATVTIHSVAGGAPAVVSFAGYYKGTRGNRISYMIDDDPSTSGRDRIQFFFDGVLQESYTFDATTETIATLVSKILRASRLIKSTAIVPTAANRLVHTSGAPVALTGGNDGSTLTGTDHLNALDALATSSFGLLAPFDLTDPAILATYQSYLAAELAANRPFRLVVGGAAGELVSDAISRSAGLGSEHVVNFGCGTYHDDLLDKDLSTSQLAPRLAGILAAKGMKSSVTFSPIGGLHQVAGVARDEVQFAVDNGVVVLVPSTSADADLMVEKGVTTYIADSPALPHDVFGDPRLVGIMDTFTLTAQQWGNNTIIGKVPVNDDSRSAVRGYARGLEDQLLQDGLILPANPAANPPVVAPWVVCEDPGDPALEDTIPFTFGWRFAKTANNIVGQGTIA